MSIHLKTCLNTSKHITFLRVFFKLIWMENFEEKLLLFSTKLRNWTLDTIHFFLFYYNGKIQTTAFPKKKKKLGKTTTKDLENLVYQIERKEKSVFPRTSVDNFGFFFFPFFFLCRFSELFLLFFWCSVTHSHFTITLSLPHDHFIVFFLIHK